MEKKGPGTRPSRWTLAAPALTLALVLAIRLASPDGRAFVVRTLTDPLLPARPAAEPTALRPGLRRETMAVLLISSQCVAARDPALVPAVARMKETLLRQARAEGRTLHLVGVSVDYDLAGGLRFLSRLGPFHEVTVGANWLNHDVVQLVWRDPETNPTVPQWVIVERDVAIRDGRFSVGPDRVVARVEGIAGMVAWTEQARKQLGSSSAARR